MIDKTWQVLKSEYLVRAPWAMLRKDVCKMPSGQLVPAYYVLEYPHWVNVVGVTEEGLIILIKQYRHGAAQEFLEIPGGVIDDGETDIEAAKREMLEETGYVFDDFKQLCLLYANPATSNNHTTTFLAWGGRKVRNQQLDLQEEIEVLLATKEEVKQLLLDNRFGQSLHTSALFYGLLSLEKLK